MADVRQEVRDFLSSRRARIAPEQAGLPAYGGNRRVAGLRREEVALLAGVSVDYYVRLERGNISGASDSVLDALATTLQLDGAEREYLFDLARTASSGHVRKRRKATSLRTGIRQVLAAIDSPAWVRNARFDVIGMNGLAAALYSPMLEEPHRPLNTARFAYLSPRAETFFRDHDHVLNDAAAMLRLEAGRSPHDPDLVQLVGELSTRSEVFRQRWASQDVKEHRSGRKRLHHPVVGDLDLDYEGMDFPNEPGLRLNIYTAPVGSPSADGLKMLASWAASTEDTETVTSGSPTRTADQ